MSDASNASGDAEAASPFDPRDDIYSGISTLSRDDWLELTAFFCAAVHDHPTTEALMRSFLKMDKADAFRTEFADGVALFVQLMHCGEKFQSEVEDKMLGLADDIVHYEDASSVTYERLIDLIDRFDFDGATAVTTSDERWLQLAEAWRSGTPQGRSDALRLRFQTALDQLIEAADTRATRAQALQQAILAPDGILATLKQVQADFASKHLDFETAIGKESAEITELRASIATLNAELGTLRKKEHDEVLVLETSPVYLVIPIFGFLILAGVDIGVGVDLAHTRAKITAKQQEIDTKTAKMASDARFMAYYKTTNDRVDDIGNRIEHKVLPRLSTLGLAWRAIASDLGAVRHGLGQDGVVALQGANWFNLVTVLKTARRRWQRIATQADRFRRFGGPPKRVDTVEALIAAATQAAGSEAPAAPAAPAAPVLQVG
ncbi:alpha-xenorhabdolysin family binary toxin subunit A [Rubrivivax sp. RP6-9]|uniref:alpha-xenorhabdolysin family binary toxin subunit A n=1 Tax=Rubrivivax sp. RP6-9 TaxID=3415750 RepID=UPI003CC53564